MARKLLILGVDPGTVSAFALVDLYGHVVAVRSSRVRSLFEQVVDIKNFGVIAFVGSDVTPTSRSVRRIASILGARVISPDRNISHLDKQKFLDEFLKRQDLWIDIGNRHEKDALVGAIIGYRKVRPIVKRIVDHLESVGMTGVEDYVFDRVLRGGESIVESLREL